jgi:hypothetical protein
MKKIIWPKDKKFAFTIIDDTDNCTIENIKPVYDLLQSLGIISTKTVWVYSSRDRFTGDYILNPDYLKFIQKLKFAGYEIALHGIGSGDFSRNEILTGLDVYKNLLGEFPKMHINHAQNSHNIYSGNRSGSKLLQFYSRLKSPKDKFYGDDESSEFFWGDWAKKNIKYMRGRTFSEINTLKQDPLMPYTDIDKVEHSNLWFSSSDGADVNNFCRLLSEQNISKLENEGGLCIVYTHFASGFTIDGSVHEDFRQKISQLASKDCWFAPASDILDYLISQKGVKKPSQLYFSFLDIREILKNKIKRILH